MAYRSLRRRSIAASLTIALEDHVGRQIAAKQRPRLVSCKGSKGSCRGWRSGGGKHLGHRTARCSLRGNGSSCSARPKGPQTLPGTPPNSLWSYPRTFSGDAPVSGRSRGAPLRSSPAKCRAANGASGPAALLRPPEHPAATASGLSLLTGCAFLARQVAECNALKRAARGHAPAQPRGRPPERHRRAVLHRQQH